MFLSSQRERAVRFVRIAFFHISNLSVHVLHSHTSPHYKQNLYATLRIHVLLILHFMYNVIKCKNFSYM